jgi:hypothetical protein
MGKHQRIAVSTNASRSPASNAICCANCGELIGNLETPFVWNDNPVCARCHQKLSGTAKMAVLQTVDYARPGLDSTGVRVDPTDEHEVFRTTLHPLRVFIKPAVAVFFFFIVALRKIGPDELFVLLMVAALFLASAFIRYYFSQFVITNRRIVMKTGWLSWRSFELLLSKVESIQVEQHFIDGMLGSGVVVIHGTGGSSETFRSIRNAVKFREVATEAIERYVSRRSA